MYLGMYFRKYGNTFLYTLPVFHFHFPPTFLLRALPRNPKVYYLFQIVRIRNLFSCSSEAQLLGIH